MKVNTKGRRRRTQDKLSLRKKRVIEVRKAQLKQDQITGTSLPNTDQLQIPNEIIYGSSIIAQEDVNKAQMNLEELEKERKRLTDNDAKLVATRDKTDPNLTFSQTTAMTAPTTARFQRLYMDSGTSGTGLSTTTQATYTPIQDTPLICEALPTGADKGKCLCSACRASRKPAIKQWYRSKIITAQEQCELQINTLELTEKGFSWMPEIQCWKKLSRCESKARKEANKQRLLEITRTAYKIWTCYHMTDDYDKVIKVVCDECKCRLK